MLSSSREFIFAISRDGTLVQTNRPLLTLFPHVDELQMRGRPYSDWLGSATSSLSARRLAEDIGHAAREGGIIDRSDERLGSEQAPHHVSWKVMPLIEHGAPGSSEAGVAAPSATGVIDVLELPATALGVLVVVTDGSRVADLVHELKQLKQHRADAALLRDVVGSLLAQVPTGPTGQGDRPYGVPYDAVARHVDAISNGEIAERERDAHLQVLRRAPRLLYSSTLRVQ